MKKIIIFSLLAGVIVWFGRVYDAFSNSPKTLSNPQKFQSLVALERIPSGIVVGGGSVFIFFEQNSVFSMTPFKGLVGKKTREERFGQITDSKRIKLPSILKGSTLVGGVVHNNLLLMLDGVNFRSVVYEYKSGQINSVRSIPWDLIKPARDRGGEPTTPEISKLRKKFYRNVMKTLGLKFSGISKAPESWFPGKRLYFLLASRVPEFPLVAMSCLKDNPSVCQMDRSCFLEGAKGLLPKGISGIAVRKKTREVFIGDRLNHKILKFRFKSCFHVQKTGELILPAKIKELSTITIDEKDRLWVVTQKPDDYFNASVFVWGADGW